jgi:hypothetical protein
MPPIRTKPIGEDGFDARRPEEYNRRRRSNQFRISKVRAT